MIFTLPRKFLCCLPLETGCFIIGGFSIAVGILCLNFFIVAVPYTSVNIQDKLLLAGKEVYVDILSKKQGSEFALIFRIQSF